MLTTIRQIREFFLRFSEALNVKRPLLEALEDFAWMERDVAVGCLAALLDALRLDRPADTRKVCVIASRHPPLHLSMFATSPTPPP